MIEQKTSLGEATMTVSFEWDNGDPSVGIGAGWGEGTGVEIKAGPFVTYVLFDVDIDKPVKDWRIDEVQCAYENEPQERVRRNRTFTTRSLTVMADELAPTNPFQTPDRTLESLPVVCAAVERVWDQVQAFEALETAGERVWEAEENVHDLEERPLIHSADLLRELYGARVSFKAAKANRDRLQAEYDEKYGSAADEIAT